MESKPPYRIDPSFSLPALAAENREELKRLMIRDGRCISPIVYWKETGILLDGRIRLEIIAELRADRHPAFPDPEVRPMSFPSAVAAKEWRLRHQLGRRAHFDRFALVDAFVRDEELMRTITVPAQE